VRKAGMESITQASIGRWFTPAFVRREPGVAAAFAADLRRTDPDGYAACCAAIAGMDLRSELVGISAPTMVIAGTDDAAAPPAHGALIAMDAGGSARLRVIRGVSHLANVAAPGEVSAILVGHLTADASHFAR
jgi:pimeloyl-ACP methyl ester carboxylesterase